MKRVFGSEGDESIGSVEPQFKRQRPMISAMREVMGVQFMHKNLPKLEPFLRRVVQEEVGNALCRFMQSSPRVTINRIQDGATSKRYRLNFENSLPHTLFTGSRIEAECKMPVQISIMDTESKRKITSGPLSSAKIEILVIDGDFGGDDQVKEFSDSVVREREGKRPLLTGELVVTLSNGVGCLGDAAFTDNSSWIRSRKFRLGARLLQNQCVEVSVREAISGPFFVKDHRGELYKKHHPPSLGDEVWRLEKIGKDGAFHRRLADNGINTVQDFLKSFVMGHERLRSVLGSGMSNKIWEATIEHAKECVMNDRYYSYCNGQGVMLLFNSIFEVVGAMFDHNYHPSNDLDASQKIVVNKLKQLAYKNPEEIIELNMSETENAVQGNEHDPLQMKEYFLGHGLHPLEYMGPSQREIFNTREVNDHLDNSEIDLPNSFSPCTIWENGNGFADSSGGLINGSHVSPGKWVKLLAALKWMAVSKHLATNAGPGEWFASEG